MVNVDDKQEAAIAAEEAQEASDRAFFDALDGDGAPEPMEPVEATEPVEETLEVDATDEGAPEELEQQHSPEYEDAKKRLAFAKIDPEQLGLSEEQAVAFAAALRDEHVSRDRTLQELAEARKQLEASGASTPTEPTGEQDGESGRPTPEPTPAPTVDTSELFKPLAVSLGLDESETAQLGDVVNQIASAAAQAATSSMQDEMAQLRGGMQDLVPRVLKAEYGDRFPKATADVGKFQDLVQKAYALASAGDGDVEAAMQVVYNGTYGAPTVERTPSRKQRKTSSTPATGKKSSGPTSKEEADYEFFLSLDKKQ